MRSLEGGAVVSGVPGYQQALGRLASLFFEVLSRNAFFTPSGPFSHTRAPKRLSSRASRRRRLAGAVMVMVQPL